MKHLERQNLELVHRLREEQDKLANQEKMFIKQLDGVKSEHTMHLTRMGSLLASQKKVVCTAVYFQ